MMRFSDTFYFVQFDMFKLKKAMPRAKAVEVIKELRTGYPDVEAQFDTEAEAVAHFEAMQKKYPQAAQWMWQSEGFNAGF